MDYQLLRTRLRAIGQEHVLRFWDALSEASRAKLAAQIDGLDIELIGQLAQSHVKVKPATVLPGDIQPVRAYPRRPDAEHRALYQQAEQRGWELLRQGRIAALLVAGGQGTRLGCDGPKGEFPITPVKRKPLFHVFAEQLQAYSLRAGRNIPWYIMTSHANDTRTREFFARNRFFGLPPQDVIFFQQGVMPAYSLDGRLLLAEKDSLALSPDGHGGSLRALARSGALADMKSRGIEHLSYFQVDNPLVHCIDPLFLGLHDLTGSEMASKTIPKAHALEPVGNFVLADGVLRVIEYTDLPDALAQQTNPDGSLRFNYASIAIHALRVSFVERLNTGGQLCLPWHRAEKRVPFIDEAGRLIRPERPNAVKLEQFVFDAIPLARNPIIYTTERAEEFSPVKNAEGTDSPATCRRDQIRRAARWLREVGVEIPMKDNEVDAVLEISPLYALTASELRARNVPIRALERGASVYFGPDGLE